MIRQIGLHLRPPKNRPSIVIPQLPHISHSAMASTEISAAGLGFVLFLPMNWEAKEQWSQNYTTSKYENKNWPQSERSLGVSNINFDCQTDLPLRFNCFLSFRPLLNFAGVLLTSLDVPSPEKLTCISFIIIS